MEDLITVIIIIAGIAINVHKAFKKRKTESANDDSSVNWEDFFSEVEEAPPPPAVIPRAPSPPPMQEENLRQLQIEQDSAILEAQKHYAQLAEQAQAVNRNSLAEETSSIYTQAADNEQPEAEHNPADWAELIRSNRTEAVVVSEILAPPAALR